MIIITNINTKHIRLPFGKDEMMSVDSVYALDKILRNGREAVSLAQLAQQLGCSQRTVKRLIKTMREQWDAPLDYDREYGGYHYTQKDYQLPGVWFSCRN